MNITQVYRLRWTSDILAKVCITLVNSYIQWFTVVRRVFCRSQIILYSALIVFNSFKQSTFCDFTRIYRLNQQNVIPSCWFQNVPQNLPIQCFTRDISPIPNYVSKHEAVDTVVTRHKYHGRWQMTSVFPSQKSSNTDRVCLSCRHHDIIRCRRFYNAYRIIVYYRCHHI